MKNNLETSLRSYYAQFSVDHEQRRNQLLRSLSAVQHRQRQALAVSGGRTGMSQAWKSALALAAGLIIVVGAIFYVWPQDTAMDTGSGNGAISLNPLSPQEVYAAAMERATKVESLHFIWTTPNASKGASIEMWWRAPNSYRMEFAGNGLTLANDGDKGGSDPLALFALKELGRYFLLQRPLSKDEQELLAKDFTRDLVERCRVVQSEPVIHKGEKCLKVVCVDDQWRYEYIIDAQAGTDTRIPFYEVKQYSQHKGGRLMSHVEVLEVNKDYADSTFTVK